MHPFLSAIESAYFVCTTHRSGSTLFCEALSAAGCGAPNEFFEETLRAIWRDQWALPADADDDVFLREALRRGTASGVFGAKLMWHQTPRALSLLRPLAGQGAGDGLAETFASALPNVRYFWVRRRDVVAQAVSLVRARQSGRWHSVDTTGWIAAAPASKAESFDFKEIDEIVQQLTAWDQKWARFFERHRLETMTLIYEDYTARYESALREALAFAGRPLDARAQPPPPRHRKLGDAVNVEWVERYREMKAGMTNDE